MTDPAKSVPTLTLEEKASLTSGLNFWFTKPVSRVGIPSIMLTDGPHGIRKQTEGGDHLGLTDSVPATCFPPPWRWDARSTRNCSNRSGSRSASRLVQRR